MKGLLTKDFLTIKKKYGIARAAMDLAIIAALTAFLEEAGAVCVSLLLVPLEIASMMIALANLDEQWKWGEYAAALPLSKRQIVAARYAFAGMGAFAGFCVALAANTASYFCFPEYGYGFYLFLSAASFCAALLFLALILPSNYWRGVNAGFAVMFLLVVLWVVIGIWARAAGVAAFAAEHFGLCAAAGFFGAVVLFALSYRLSAALFQRKYA